MGIKYQPLFLDESQEGARGISLVYDHVLHKVGKFVILAQLYVRPFCAEVFLVFCLRHVGAIDLLEKIPLRCWTHRPA